MRRLAAVVALVILAQLVGAESAQPAVKFVLKGRGWGHAIGLSQYGAQGYARLDGRRYRWILRHFYPHTSLGTRSRDVRVRLAAALSSLKIGSTASFEAGSKTFKAGTWRVRAGSAGKLKLVKGTASRTVSSPARFRPRSAPLRLGNDHDPYRGRIVIRRSGSKLWALNVLGLNGYVKGVVPREMPASWHRQALRAQAVAARSYALAAGGHCAWFGASAMCPDTRDQVYGGLGGEAASTNEAVEATAGKVVVFAGAVATTYFFSTSGGKTAAVDDEWGAPYTAYLVSVSDPFDRISPHHRWGPRDPEVDCPGTARDCVWSGPAMRRRLGGLAPRRLRDLRVTDRNGSSRVARVAAVGSSTTTLTGAALRSALGLRSTWYRIGMLRLTGGGSIQKGQEKKLFVRTRNVGKARLQRRRAGTTSWADLRSVKGRRTVTVHPAVTTFYRLSTRTATTSPIRVSVRSSLTVRRQAGDRRLGVSTGR
jgi:stage II sporulation protein D